MLACQSTVKPTSRPAIGSLLSQKSGSYYIQRQNPMKKGNKKKLLEIKYNSRNKEFSRIKDKMEKLSRKVKEKIKLAIQES